MTTYYLDFETLTNGFPDPRHNKIVTIQNQPFWDDTGRQKGSITILKSWESSEKDILQQFLDICEWDREDNPFHFVPAGYNVSYELLLVHYCVKELLGIEISPWFLFQKLHYYDLKQIVLLANKGRVKGALLHNFSSKPMSGEMQPNSYKISNGIN